MAAGAAGRENPVIHVVCPNCGSGSANILTYTLTYILAIVAAVASVIGTGIATRQ